MNVNVKQFCPSCYGLGYLGRYKGDAPCIPCHTTGYVTQEAKNKDDEMMLAFIHQINENPTDETTRKVFADWLEERGHDEEAAIQRKVTAEVYNRMMSEMTAFARSISGRYLFGASDYEEDNSSDWRRDEYGHHEITVDKLLRHAHAYLKSTTNNTRGTMICLPFEIPDAFNPNWELFWEHFSLLTGIPVSLSDRHHNFIRCAC